MACENINYNDVVEEVENVVLEEVEVENVVREEEDENVALEEDGTLLKVDDELIDKFQTLMKKNMTKKTFDLRKQAERLERQASIVSQKDDIFEFFKKKTQTILSSYFSNPEDTSIKVSPWRIFNQNTGYKEEYGNRFEVFTWTNSLRKTKKIPYDIAAFFKIKTLREQLLERLSEEFRKLLGNEEVEFRIYFPFSKSKKTDFSKVRFTLNIYIPYTE